MRFIDKSKKMNNNKSMTLKYFEDLFGEAPNLKHKMIRLFPQFTLQMITEGLGKIRGIKFDGNPNLTVNNSYIEWGLEGETTRTVKIGLAVTDSDIGKNFQRFNLCFVEKYYDVNDLIELENGQVLRIESEGVELASGVWQHRVHIFGDNPDEVVDQAWLASGKDTSYLTNAQPELSEEGFIKDKAGAEMHREYLTTYRHGYSISGHAASTKWYIKDDLSGEEFYMKEADKRAMEIFYLSRENILMFGKSSVNNKGICMVKDPKGRDIIAGNGLENQLHSSSKMNYSELTKRQLQEILENISDQTGGADTNGDGRLVTLMTGSAGYYEWQRLMENTLKAGDCVYATRSGNSIKLGGDFREYVYGDMRILLAKNRVLDYKGKATRKDSKGRALTSSNMYFIDSNTYGGEANIQSFTRKGRSMVIGELAGLGGMDGVTSGKIATSIDGSSKHILGEIGLRVLNPYSSWILKKEVI